MDLINVTVLHDGKQCTLNLMVGDNLLESLQSAGFYLPAICGAKGTCGKCKIKLADGILAVTDADKRYFSDDDLKEGYRLSCMAFPDGNITISILTNNEEDFSVLTFFDQESAGKQIAAALAEYNEVGYSIAIDIGTTTIAFSLLDMRNGIVVDNLTVVNKQREYGADVISRILNATKGKLPAMTHLVRTQISACIQNICDKNNIDAGMISDIAIAANTTMIHLLLGLSCDTLGVYPFTPVTLAHIIKEYSEIFEGSLNAKVHILPGISTYVGADITAGIYFSELYKKARPSLLLDIGTNGEMAVCKDGKIFCTATAAGPAFEGGNISCGTGSVPGAISTVKYNGAGFSCETIGNKPAIGICGSGVIDIVYACLKNGLINGTGRFGKEYGNKGVLITKTQDGREITFTQKDIRELQLGKSAIRSGVDTLLNFAELAYSDIETLYVAGGFGFRINFESATALGLIPSEFIDRITLIGNSSLGGTVKYLFSKSSSTDLDKIVDISFEHNLPQDKLFNKLFIENMTF